MSRPRPADLARALGTAPARAHAAGLRFIDRWPGPVDVGMPAA